METARLVVLVVAGLLSAGAARADLDSLLAATPADQLVLPLRRLEADRSRPSEGLRAALALGQLYLARGEYREAAELYARTAARLDPARKDEARYWQGIAWLALNQPAPARAALEEVARGGGPRRAAAQLGVAQAWEMAGQPRRAYDAITQLLEWGQSDVEPAALERAIALGEKLDHPDEARRARERLLRIYPRSIEAAATRVSFAGAEEAGTSAVTVVIGSFVDRARAVGLASEARRAGFSQATVVTRGAGLTAVHLVQLGTYPHRAEARQAGEQAERALGVAYRIVKLP